MCGLFIEKMKRQTFNYTFLNFFLLILFVDCVHLQNLSETIKTNNSIEVSTPNNFYKCSPTHEERMIARCPAGYTDKEIIRKCEKAFSSLDEEDFSIIIPATNFKSNVHYANQYCAICHNDSSFELWECTVSWSTKPLSALFPANRSQETNEGILSTLHYNATLKKHVVSVNNVSVPCSFDSVKPKSLNSSSCPIKFVWECTSPSEEPKECSNFTGNPICTSTNYVYANTECARCNNYNPQDVLVPCDNILKKFIPIKHRTSPNAALTLFKLKKSSGDACSLPAVAKYYC